MAGRFAPSPTGPLHLGSLVTALASFLDAKAQGLAWWVRMEDLDPPREVPGAADWILRQLADHGLRWDPWPAAQGGRPNGVLYQSDRAQGLPIGTAGAAGTTGAVLPSAYSHALDRLIDKGMAFRCRCSRSRLAEYWRLAATSDRESDRESDGEAEGEETEPLYPGLCRPPASAVAPTERHAWRFFNPAAEQAPGLASQPQDNFVVRRADGLWAYHLAVVVDDAFQGVTRVVRGADLRSALPRQRLLQKALELDIPAVIHVPVVVNALGQKLSKQALAPALGGSLGQIQGQRLAAWAHLEAEMPADWIAQVRPWTENFLGSRIT